MRGCWELKRGKSETYVRLIFPMYYNDRENKFGCFQIRFIIEIIYKSTWMQRGEIEFS